MLGFIPVAHGASVPAGPTIDPPTFAHPSRALGEAQRLANDAIARAAALDEPLASVVIVAAFEDEWSAACPDCLRGVGSMHDCTGRSGPVTPLFAVLMHADHVRA